MRSPTLLPIRMNAAETSASRAIADWTPLTVVPRSRTTAEIETFISDVSTTSTNIAMASRIPSRRLVPWVPSSPVPAAAVTGDPFCHSSRATASPQTDDQSNSRQSRVRVEWCPLGIGRPAEVVDRGLERRKEVVGVERTDQLVALELCPNRILELREHERGAGFVELLVEVGEHVGRGGVHIGDRHGGDHDPSRRGLSGGQAPDLLAEGPGVGKEELRVEPEDHQPGKLLGLGVQPPVVIPGHAWDAPEGGLIGPPCPAEYVEDRKGDGDHDA